jgi:CheY-like chemotaxis protein
VAVRVLVVDDHPSFRRLAARLLAVGGYEVVGLATDGAEALDEIVRLRPDVVLLDVLLPGIDGFEVADRISHSHFRPVIVLVSSRTRLELADRLAGAPIRGFLSKSELTLQSLHELLR